MIEDAIYFATTAHAGQKRKGTDIPYILHPLEAAAIATRFEYDEILICAAILHDVVEDTGIPLKVIEKRFGTQVANLVAAVSEDKTKTWKERKQATIDHIGETPDEKIRIVTLCDKLANIRSIRHDQIALGEEVWKRFNSNKNDIGWYYKGLVESLKSLSKSRSYQEFSKLVEEVFGNNKYVKMPDEARIFHVYNGLVYDVWYVYPPSDSSIFYRVWQDDDSISYVYVYDKLNWVSRTMASTYPNGSHEETRISKLILDDLFQRGYENISISNPPWVEGRVRKWNCESTKISPDTLTHFLKGQEECEPIL